MHELEWNGDENKVMETKPKDRKIIKKEAVVSSVFQSAFWFSIFLQKFYSFLYYT